MRSSVRRSLHLLLAGLAVLAGLGVAQAQTATATSLASSLNPSVVGQNTTLTATVTPSSASGTVTFRDGSTTLGTGTLSNGVATLARSFSATGNRSLQATYGGSGSFAASTSAVYTQTVNPKTNTTTALASSVNPSGLGQTTTLRATVTGTAPTGTVTFKDGSATLGTGTLANGVATLDRSFSSMGSRSLTVVYAGDVSNNGSTSAVLTQTVGKASSSTVLTATPSPSQLQAAVTLQAMVTGSSPTGSVTFMDGSAALGTRTLSNRTATLVVNFDSVGTRLLTAVYAGNSSNNGSTSPAVSHAVTRAQASVTLSSDTDPADVGGSTLLRADVSGSNNVTADSGTVTFYDGAAVLGTGEVQFGIATLAATFDTVGRHTLTAAYSGNEAVAPGTSPPLDQRVVRPSSVSLASSLNPSTTRDAVALSATVTPSTATGTVTFSDENGVLGTAALQAGVATLNRRFPTWGVRFLSALYPGDDSHNQSRSDVLPQAVDAVQAEVALSATPAIVPFSSAVTLSAAVTGADPDGTVNFTDGGVVFAIVPVSAGQAVVTQNLNTTGLHKIVARYSGDGGNFAAASSPLDLQVTGTSAANPEPSTWTFGYDAEGNPTQEQDPEQRQTRRIFDSLSRLAELRQPLPAGSSTPTTTLLGHDPQGNLTSVTDPRGLATLYTVDGLHNLKAQTSPDAGGSSAGFDAAGNLTSHTDARGKTTTYTYDALNRRTRASYASGPATLFEYDGGTDPAPYSAGRLTRITDESGTRTLGHDALGRVTAMVQTTGVRTFQVAYGFGDSGPETGSLTSVTYPSGMQVRYGYDVHGRPVSVTIQPLAADGTTVNLLGAITYNGANRMTGWTWGDGTVAPREYDSFGRLVSYPLGRFDGTGNAAGLMRTLTHDAAGRIMRYTHTQGGAAQPAFEQVFSYDDLAQLQSATRPGTLYGYGYDASGNRTRRAIGGTDYIHTVETASNRLSSVEEPSGGGTATRSYTHDAAGNLTGDGVQTFVYSDRGRMSRADTPQGSVSFLVNGLERRVSKTGLTVPTGAAYYVHDEDGRVLGEYAASGERLYEVVYLGGTPVGVVTASGAAILNLKLTRWPEAGRRGHRA